MKMKEIIGVKLRMREGMEGGEYIMRRHFYLKTNIKTWREISPRLTVKINVGGVQAVPDIRYRLLYPAASDVFFQ